MSAEGHWRRASVVSGVERAASRHRGLAWRVTASTDLTERSSHPAVLLHGAGLSVFAKVTDTVQQALDELAGLDLLHRMAGVSVPVPVGAGWVGLPDGRAVLLTEALPERVPADRGLEDWAAIGRALATIHSTSAEHFGLGHDGWFGPLRQDNRPVPGNTWSEFYGARRVLAWLATAQDAGHLSPQVVKQVERLVRRLPELGGGEPVPTLLHGDAQHHNFLSTAAGAVVIDASPYFGHPEVDLALLDYFAPVPTVTFSAYAEARPLADGWQERRELWRIHAYLAVLTVDGDSAWGRQFTARLEAALGRYR